MSVASSQRFKPPSRGSQASPKQSLAGSRSAPSLASDLGSPASEQCKNGDAAERRESSQYSYQHKDGFMGHIPLDARNKGKYGKTSKKMEWNGPSLNKNFVERWQQDLKDYTRSHRVPKKPIDRDEAAGLSNAHRSRVDAETGLGLRTAKQEDTRRDSSEYNYSHKEGYMGHSPETGRNLSKYGKTFGNSEQFESDGSISPARRTQTKVDRLGRGPDLHKDDPRPCKVDAEIIFGPVPRMYEQDPQAESRFSICSNKEGKAMQPRSEVDTSKPRGAVPRMFEKEARKDAEMFKSRKARSKTRKPSDAANGAVPRMHDDQAVKLFKTKRMGMATSQKSTLQLL